MTSNNPRPAAHARFDAFDFARGLAILGMLGSHLVGTEGGANAFERGITGVLATIEPTVGALFCVLAGVAWSIQAERVGVTPRFRRYIAGRALALGLRTHKGIGRANRNPLITERSALGDRRQAE